jgi:hypothetical protein
VSISVWDFDHDSHERAKQSIDHFFEKKLRTLENLTAGLKKNFRTVHIHSSGTVNSSDQEHKLVLQFCDFYCLIYSIPIYLSLCISCQFPIL